MPDNNNKSLFIYTGLIFLVAVILIIVAFFGQSKIDNNQPIPISQEEVNSISERASVLSEENKVLIEENLSIKNDLENTKKDLIEAKAKNALYEKNRENTKLLESANVCFIKSDRQKAGEFFALIDASLLSEDEKIIYDNIAAFVNNNN